MYCRSKTKYRIMKKTLLMTTLMVSFLVSSAQDEIAQITSTLNDYIEGTASGQPDRLKEAFYEDFNLFLVAQDTLRVIDGKGYISRVENGKEYNREARILSIDVENDAAVAKIEVYFPDDNRRATDYLLLLKTEERWKIVHKLINLNAFENAGELVVENSNELARIQSTLDDYMEGTATSNINRLRKAFHEDLNLYYVKDGAITIIPGTQYLENFRDGRKFNRIGKILSLDYEDNAAIAKLQILMPDRNRIAIDYLLLLKINQQWTIIHKSFTSKNY